MTKDPDKSRRVKEVVADALLRERAARDSFLTHALGSDAELLAEARALLAAADDSSGTVAMSAGAATSSPASTGDARFPAGTLFANRYRIVTLLGRGGMGEVYRADDVKLGQPVAIKLLPEATAASAGMLARLHAEVRIARQVSHPNVCRVYDIGESDGCAYITMEYVDGEDMASLLRRIGRLPFDKATEIAQRLCAGLAAAHDKGVLHRDLKPANVMIDGRGQVLITDFGLAGLAGQIHDGEIRNGTPAYMAPEQLAGREVTVRSDIYALGLVLYEMYTGRRPFEDARRGPLSSASSVVKDIDPAVDAVIARCLEDDPHKRPSSAASIAAALPGGDPLAAALAEVSRLQRELSTPHAPSAAAAPVPRHRMLAGALVVAALVAVAAGIFWWRSAPAAGPMTIKRVSSTGTAEMGAISPDGKYLAYVDAGAAGHQILLRQLSTEGTAQVLSLGKTHPNGLCFAPDGDHLAYVTSAAGVNTMFLVPTLGGVPQQTAANVGASFAFSPDGAQVAYVRSEGRGDSRTTRLMLARADGSGERQLLAKGGVDAFNPKVSWSPDGKWIALLKSDKILVTPASGGPEQTLAPQQAWNVLESVAWLPGSKALLVTSQLGGDLDEHHQIFRVSYPGGEVRRITNDLNDYHLLSTGARGTQLACIQHDSQHSILISPADAPDQTHRLQAPRTDGKWGVAWMDNSQILESDTRGVLWTMKDDGSGRRPFTSEQRLRTRPVRCGPDKLVYLSGASGATSHVWVSALDGSNARQLTHGSREADETCTPDGKWVYYTSGNDEAIERIPVEGGAPSPVRKDAHTPVISPEGNWFAMHYTGPEDQAQHRERLAIAPLDGSAPPKVLPAPVTRTLPKWTPDGKFLTYLDNGQGSGNLWNQPVDGGPPRQVTHSSSADTVVAFDWSPDGKRLVVVRIIPSSDIVVMSGF